MHGKHMMFNSVSFLIFFIVVTTLYFLVAHRYRWFLLLVSSVIFYVSFIPVYILVLGLVIAIDYFAAILIEKRKGNKRKFFLMLSILSTSIVLLIFKYYNFFNANLSVLAKFLHWNYSISALSLVLPIGLSFHTFQSLSYVIEVYWSKQKAEKNFGIYALYVMFYPQLVAGPIERPQNLLHQFYEKHKFDFKRVADGLKLMLWGYFMKLVVADRLAIFVNIIYSHPRNYVGFPLVVATVLFSFQIYCDFAGYSTIALGIAKVMGFKLTNNFESPYFAKSISGFWQRWHISLSTWFRDYLYTPLIGTTISMRRLYLSILIVFLVSGLWHGANWTFVIWGALHGLFMVVSIMTEGIRNKISEKTGLSKFQNLHNAIKIITTFSLVSFTYIFFRANSLSDAFYIITNLTTNIGNGLNGVFLGSDINMENMIIALTAVIVLLAVNILQERESIIDFISNKSSIFRWSSYVALIMVILIFGAFNNIQFIYFQF